MNKTHYLLYLLILFFALSSCTNSDQPQYRIGLSQCFDDAWRQKMNAEMERELLLHPDIILTKRIAYGNNALQCAQIDSFIAEQVDLIIVSPNEAEEVRPAVSRAYNADIPVIVADRRVPGDEWTAFIGGDNYGAGVLMAKWVQKVQAETPHPLHVLEVSGLLGSTPEMLRHQGLVERLRGTGDGLQVTGYGEDWQANRQILWDAMLRHGFTMIDSEWWHFTLANEPYPDTYFDFPIE